MPVVEMLRRVFLAVESTAYVVNAKSLSDSPMADDFSPAAEVSARLNVT